MEEPAAEFASSLRDLTTNSKPLITMLTMIAEESKEHAPKIVEAIEEYLKTVSVSPHPAFDKVEEKGDRSSRFSSVLKS